MNSNANNVYMNDDGIICFNNNYIMKFLTVALAAAFSICGSAQNL